MIRILSETFAPPMIATNGFSDCKTFLHCLLRFIKSPNILLSGAKICNDRSRRMPCAVPNASLTYTSPAYNCPANFSRLFLLLYESEDFPATIPL
jgi:hypothetical protein